MIGRPDIIHTSFLQIRIETEFFCLSLYFFLSIYLYFYLSVFLSASFPAALGCVLSRANVYSVIISIFAVKTSTSKRHQVSPRKIINFCWSLEVLLSHLVRREAQCIQSRRLGGETNWMGQANIPGSGDTDSVKFLMSSFTKR